MTDLITMTDGNIFKLELLPDDLQKQIKNYAMMDILKDQAKEGILAKRIDINKYLNQWLKTKESERTQITYRKAMNDFFKFVQKIGVEHPLLVKAEHVDQYIIELKSKFKNNSIRLKVTACSSFYSMLKRYGYVKLNPFYNSALPAKEYKKAIRVDQNKTIPVMNDKEYELIISHLKGNAKLKGKHASINNIKECSRDLIPAVHFMAVYGLRVGSINTIETRDGYFSFTSKGNKSYTQDLKQETTALLKECKRTGNKPFKQYKTTTIQHAFKRVTDSLKAKGLIRYNYSCHDLRHYFAQKFYNETKDIVKLKSILGHASLNVTDIYLQSIGIR